MSVSQDDRETLEREDASMLCNLEKIYNRKGVKQSDTTLVINELMKALADTNATVEISNLIDYPKQVFRFTSASYTSYIDNVDVIVPLG